MLTSLIVNKKYLQARGKNLQYAAESQWHRYKKSNEICYNLKSNIEKYKQRGAQRSGAFVYILSIFAGFLLTLVCVLIWSWNMVNPT